jgi:rubrerythrin
MRTEENLKNAFAGESQAYRRYRAFADRAEREGYPNVAKLFRAVSESEAVHATNELLLMKALKTTAENLQTAIDGETYEYTKMYPDFSKAAEKESKKAAVKIFGETKQVESFHATYYKEALENVEKMRDLPSRDYYVCSVCGHTVADEAPDKCPVCNSKKSSFKKIE